MASTTSPAKAPRARNKRVIATSPSTTTDAQAFVDSHRDEGTSELFGITELCNEFGITLRALRFYEDKGLLAPRRINGARVYTRRDRARLALILRAKAIGSPLIAVHAVPDLPKHVQERLYFLRFEDLVENPALCMSAIFKWLGLPPCEIDPERLDRGVQESDSHYHMKYMHKQADRIGKPARHEVAPRIQAQIETAWAWYYQSFYPQLKK